MAAQPLWVLACQATSIEQMTVERSLWRRTCWDRLNRFRVSDSSLKVSRAPVESTLSSRTLPLRPSLCDFKLQLNHVLVLKAVPQSGTVSSWNDPPCMKTPKTKMNGVRKLQTSNSIHKVSSFQILVSDGVSRSAHASFVSPPLHLLRAFSVFAARLKESNEPLQSRGSLN